MVKYTHIIKHIEIGNSNYYNNSKDNVFILAFYNQIHYLVKLIYVE